MMNLKGNSFRVPNMLNQSSARNLILLILAVGAIHATPRAGAALTTVWRLGTFDHSSAEFDQSVRDNRVPETSVIYVIGKSRSDRDWPAFQPGSGNEQAGRRPHPYAIRFNLPNPPQGLYTLKIDFVLNNGVDLSALQIEINGRRGWAHPHPVWSKPWDNDVAQRYWTANVEIELPSAALKQGDNDLVLTAIDGSPGLTYDALELHQDSAGSFEPGKLTVRLEPTIFYKKTDGQLVELVDAFISHNSPSRHGRVELTVGDHRLSGELPGDHEFGEEHLEFLVPAFAPGTKAVASVTLIDQPKQFAAVLNPEKRWNLLLVPNMHLDIGYTGSQGKVAEIHSRSLDEAMQLIHDHPDFRYSMDAFWVLQQFCAGRDAKDQQELLRLMKERKIFCPAQYVNLLTQFPTVETLIRSLYPSFEFARKSDLDFDYANLTDVPSASRSYASVLAAAGLKYFPMASNPVRGPILLMSDLKAKSPYWWEGPDGGRVLMWYSHSYAQAWWVFGLPSRAEVGRYCLPGFLSSYMTPEYKSDTVLLYGTQGENSALRSSQANLADDWNSVYAFPHLRYSGFSAALKEIAASEANPLPVVKGDGGPYWEDGIYSDTQTALLARENEQRVLSAEKISTISTLVHPHVLADPPVIKRMWENILLTDEHTWGEWLSTATPDYAEAKQILAVKESFATEAAHGIASLRDRGLLAIGDRIDLPKGTWLVFNPLNWERSGWVEIDLEKGTELVDSANGESVPYQVLFELPNYIREGPHLHFPVFQRIRFIAKNVPAVGYKCYGKRPESSKASADAPNAPSTLENVFYRVTLDAESGAVGSIFDKELGVELVNASSPYRFNQYLYVTGGDQPSDNQLLLYDPSWPIPTLTIHPARGGRLLSTERTPFGTIAHLESTDTNTPRIQTDVILFDSEKKIEFINHVRKDKVYTKEAVYFAFPFAMDGPEFRYDGQNGVINPEHDLLPGAAREWFSQQHWITARQGAVTAALVPMDAALFTLGDIVRGTWPASLGPMGGTVYSYIMNNIWCTNYIAAQGGDFTFRYVLTSATNLEPAQLSRWGWEEMTPLEMVEIPETLKDDHGTILPQPLNPTGASFLQVKQSNIVLVNWKMAEDGQGTVLRLLEVGGKESRVDIQIPILNLEGAWMCNAMEENQHPLSVSAHELNFTIRPFQIVTVRIAGSPSY
jgi:alpha-mannosidase